MSLIGNAVRNLAPARTGSTGSPAFVASSQMGQAQLPGNNYSTYARLGYMRNELVFACMNLRANSAAEPRLIARKYTTGKKDLAKAKARWLDATGAPKWMIGEVLQAKNLAQDVVDYPAAKLWNNPNPFFSKFQMGSMIIMDLDLAGNAYLWKSAKGHTPRNGRRPEELWPMRPDRMTIVPDRDKYISHYEFRIGGQVFEIPPEDIIHFKTRNPLNDYYGMPPLMPLSGRVDLDNYMQDFVKAFFQNAGVPAGVLAFKGNGKISQEDKNEIKNRWRGDFGGPGGWHELVVLGADATFTPTTMQLGQRGLVMPDLNAIGEARITAAFGIPASMVGALVGLEKSSYANNVVDWRILWQVTLMPLYADLDDQLTKNLLPDFGGSVDELIFDMGDVKALQDDVEVLMERARKNVDAGLWTIEEGRLLTGVDAVPNDGEHLLLPTRSTIVPTPIEDFQPEMPPPLSPPGTSGEQPAVANHNARASLWRIQETIRAMLPEPEPIRVIEAPKVGRKPLALDFGARGLYDRGEELRREFPRMSETQIADRLGIGASTYRRYKATFGDD